MIKVLSFIPVPAITIRFFNRGDVIKLKHNNTSAEKFYKKSKKKILKVFERDPSGGTPAFRFINNLIIYRVLQNSIQRVNRDKVHIYFFYETNQIIDFVL